jgi:hypothetical protein
MAADAPVVDEEALITAVLRLRESGGGETAPACLAALLPEFEGLTLGAVKKAASKATKRSAAAGVPPPSKAVSAAAPATEKPVLSEAKQAKQAKAEKAELKQAENAMMDTQRRLRAAKSGGDMSTMATQITGSVEDFIQKATMRAMAGLLEEGDERFLKERVEADIAALEWVRLAHKAGALSLTEDVVALGGELQLTRLKEVRGARDVPATFACYRTAAATGADGYAGVDKLVARSGALAAAPPQADGTLDDVD